MIHGSSAVNSSAGGCRCRIDQLRRRHGAGGFIIAAQRRRQPEHLRLPHLQEQDEAAIEINDAPMSTIHGLI